MTSPSKVALVTGSSQGIGRATALAFARQNIPVHVFEAESHVNDNPRAATTHAATLAMLEDLELEKLAEDRRAPQGGSARQKRGPRDGLRPRWRFHTVSLEAGTRPRY